MAAMAPCFHLKKKVHIGDSLCKNYSIQHNSSIYLAEFERFTVLCTETGGFGLFPELVTL